LRILTHPDAIVLETALFDALDAVHPRDGVGRSLVLVPTSRLAGHLRRRLAAHGGRAAWLGVEILTLHGLARAIIARSGRPAPRVLSPRLREALVRRVLQSEADNRWARFAEIRPGATARITSALDDLREAAVDPGDLRRAARGGARDEALAELYAAYVVRLAELQRAGWTDEAGLATTATGLAADAARTYGQVLVHGAYEWLGVHVGLLRELARHTDLAALMPIVPGGRVTGYAEAHARSRLLDEGETTESIVLDRPGGCGLDLSALYDEERRPHPAGEGRIRFRNTQGAVQEVRLAVQEALRAIADGCPPEEIAIVARSLEPYASALEAALGDGGLRWVSSLKVPLRRQPLTRDFLLLLETVGEDLPRRSTAELLRSSRIRWTALSGVDRAPRGDLAERWSRQARILGGLDEWTEVLVAWVERIEKAGQEEAGDATRRPAGAHGWSEEAGLIGRALDALRSKVGTDPLGWSEHARRVRRLFDDLVEPEARRADPEATEGLRALFDEMASLETVVGERRAVPFARMRSWLEEAVQSARIAPWERDEGGIRVLDAMQFRGLTFERVFLLGMNGGMFPRKLREDPVLGDRPRRELRECSGCPLVLSSEGADEERLILALIVGGSRSRLDVSWQRADEAGRARSTSLALRELARLAYGSPELDLIHSDPTDALRTVPSHPTQWLRYLATATGAMDRADAVLLRVLEGTSERDLRAVADSHEALRAGLRMIEAIRSFEPTGPEYDGRIEPGPVLDRISVSAFERLGRCPLQFFFRHVLGVAEPDDAATAEGLSPAELGGQVHALLERLYRQLDDAGLLGSDRLEGLGAWVDRWLEGERRRLFGEQGRRFTRRLPVLWESMTEAWLDALSDFVRGDLRRLAGAGWRAAGFEVGVSGRIDLGDGADVEVYGRLDRRLKIEKRSLVGDYKTSGKLSDRVEERSMLKGHQLQVPLYALLEDGDATVELLGVGPFYAALDEADRVAVFDGFPSNDRRAGFIETLGTLIDLARRGRYPLRSDRQCSWCAYRLACRWNHPPTLHRETLDTDGRRYASLQDKSTRKPRIADGGTDDD
jgi:ATP-dependent helicase/nuclease subunit B